MSGYPFVPSVFVILVSGSEIWKIRLYLDG